MEKTISVEERIRKAEEIYNRRINQNRGINYTYNRTKNGKPRNIKLNLIKKMVLQIIVCFVIYACFYLISNSEYIFSEDFRNSISSLINTQMDFNQLYNDINNYFSEILSTNEGENVDNSNEKQEENQNKNETINADESNEQKAVQNDNQETTIDSNDNSNNEINSSEIQDNVNIENEINNENIGGATEENVSELQEDSNEQKSQMEIDAENIKKSISFEVPVEGRISSTFGLRNPTTSTVPKNHTGLDIAANTGTVIKSATDGTVILASSYGDYGKHYKIQIDDVIIIYAHCSKLYLKEGDTVKKGQNIAEVGSTGNSTGPHLHFEIRKDGRLVDPQLILDI